MRMIWGNLVGSFSLIWRIFVQKASPELIAITSCSQAGVMCTGAYVHLCPAVNFSSHKQLIHCALSPMCKSWWGTGPGVVIGHVSIFHLLGVFEARLRRGDRIPPLRRRLSLSGEAYASDRPRRSRRSRRDTKMMRGPKLLHQYALQWKSTAKEVLTHSIVFAQFFSLMHLTNSYICSPTLVYGPSMLPTLNFTGDVVLVEKLSPLLGKVGPGDVVLVRSPENPRKAITKRIVGVEGDTITFLVDPSRSDRSSSVLVPKGHVWIQGDNIYASKDSRQLGPIPYGLILGKAFCRNSRSQTITSPNRSTGNHDYERGSEAVSTDTIASMGPMKIVKLWEMRVPVGVELMLLIGPMHHDPKIWSDDTNEFKLERFSDEISNSRVQSFSYIPFNFGPRVYIG
ncbi:Peptidase S24/S26A/S26B/S26C family protein [Perilla frutescens var. hirtella]|uniref:Peptidase S24/S26A/S26B/S26C family protein n=1 Tax=Perilla frutescens var. hirtella TaxID=608512 RepID=A0AAD4J007_PERFH|nr:Peptidase S24/S26A/S26B/S26C family protein [Perilla frutescens var. hirtella]